MQVFNLAALSSFICVVISICYVLAGWREIHIVVAEQKNSIFNRLSAYALFSGVFLHGVFLIVLFIDSWHFGLVRMLVFTSWVLFLLIAIFANLRKQQILILSAIMYAIVSIWLEHFFGFQYADIQQKIPFALLFHIVVISISYGFLVLVLWQSFYVYRKKKALAKHDVVQHVPSIEIVSISIGQCLLMGWLFLTIGIVSGLFFVEDFIAQKVAHKSIFTTIAWVIFSILLILRQRVGVMNIRMMYLSGIGIICLFIGYFGSRLAIEFIF